MSNSKISALTGATTPLAGTEVLPIVQSGATVNVATNDLTVRNIRANATTGILQITGPTAATTRIATVPDANWTAARTDAAQTFTGNQTISTGNLVIATSGNGITGTTTNNNANTGVVGEYVSSTIASGSAVSLTALTIANITSISLTAGDWDASGVVDFTGTTTTGTFTTVAVSTGAANVNTNGQYVNAGAFSPGAVADAVIASPIVRFSIGATTTIYLNVKANWTAGTLTGYGVLRARRVR
jgi:hypothetical protein